MKFLDRHGFVFLQQSLLIFYWNLA